VHERIDFNRLGSAGFADLCHKALRSVLGPKYCPHGTGGPDGGRDGTFEGRPLQLPEGEGYWVIQIKFHDDFDRPTPARRAFLSAVKKELGRWQGRLAEGARAPDTLVFMTNVVASTMPAAGTRDRFGELVRAAALPIRQVLLWDGAWLRLELSRPENREFLAPGTEAQKVVFEAECSFTMDHDAIITVADLGNATDRPLTIRKVNLQVGSIGVLAPSAHRSTIEVEGATFMGPGPSGQIPPWGLIRAWWLFRAAGTGLRDLLDRAQPQPARVTIECFPSNTIVRSLELFTLQRLREMMEAPGVTEPEQSP